MRVLITDKINESAKDIISSVAEVDILPTMEEDELVKIIGAYDALLVRSQTKVTAKIIEASVNMKIIGRAGVGVDNIDLDAATKKGIIVVNSPDGNTNAAAEHTLALMMSLSRNIPSADFSVKQGLWERSKFTGVEVFNKTLGIIGFGKIGQHVARAALAMGMNLVVNDPYATKEYVEKFGGKYIEHLDDFWAIPDFITVHTPKTKETASLISTNSINRMKKGVRIINCARGGIVDEAALVSAIESGQVAGAAIDVYEDEKNIQNSPLLKLGNKVVLTPHLGASTSEAQINVALDVASQVKEVLSGGDAASAVNIPALKPQILEPVKDYMPLSEAIAKIASQTLTGNLRKIDIEVKGNLAGLDVSPLSVAVLKGVLSSNMLGVNYVNAPFIAKQRGINVTVKKSEQTTDYTGSISVKLEGDKSCVEVAGALIAPHVERIVKLDNYITSIEPDKFMLLIPHKNKPNMIGQAASVLGADNVNISKMQVAQKHDSNDDISLMIINTDDVVESDTLDKISKIEGVIEPKFIKL
ncbi:MAG: phosphoglycerate dehydrogenase [Candidatus Gastranaerophilales bacterium]|nr:phosphoglycerate dehydrogenase [Candidatus Gastranaerophilales bacterium]